jgi:hypothetical protein
LIPLLLRSTHLTQNEKKKENWEAEKRRTENSPKKEDFIWIIMDFREIEKYPPSYRQNRQKLRRKQWDTLFATDVTKSHFVE